jgi:hypothetical protein
MPSVVVDGKKGDLLFTRRIGEGVPHRWEPGHHTDGEMPH